jgi:hypothetical protein
VAPVDGTYLFGATLLYKVNASTSARMSGPFHKGRRDQPRRY